MSYQLRQSTAGQRHRSTSPDDDVDAAERDDRVRDRLPTIISLSTMRLI